MSYTPTNWQTGDTITAEKLNNMEEGIASAPHAPSSTYLKKGAPVRLLVNNDGSTSWTFGFEEYDFNIEFDGTDFSVSLTQQDYFDLKNALKNSFTIIGFVTALSVGLVFQPGTYSIYGFNDLVSSIVPLDNLGLTGYVGYLLLHRDPEYGLWDVSLIKWQVS